MNYIAKFKIESIHRNIKDFCVMAEKKLFIISKNDLKAPYIQVFPCFHFAERLYDRNVNEQLAIKILTFVFKKYNSQFIYSVDTFIKYKDLVFLVNTEVKENFYKIRLNTVLDPNTSSWIKEKNGKKIQFIDVQIKDLMNLENHNMKPSIGL